MAANKQRLRILFLCTGNSCRSQMAEGWVRQLKSNEIEVFSAGVEKSGVDPLAAQVMAEAGVDISFQRSKLIDELDEKDFDYVITLCNNARESCPVFAGEAKFFHADFDDPPELAGKARSVEEKLGHYRRVRDEMREFVTSLLHAIFEAEAK